MLYQSIRNGICMSKQEQKRQNTQIRNSDDDFAEDDSEEEEYDTMELLERLETVREDMEELGVTTLAQINQRIKELHRQLDRR
jgi:transposase